VGASIHEGTKVFSDIFFFTPLAFPGLSGEVDLIAVSIHTPAGGFSLGSLMVSSVSLSFFLSNSFLNIFFFIEPDLPGRPLKQLASDPPRITLSLFRPRVPNYAPISFSRDFLPG